MDEGPEKQKTPQIEHLRFKALYPESEIQDTELNAIPGEVKKVFEWGWKVDDTTLDKNKHSPRKVSRLLVIRHSDGNVTYCAEAPFNKDTNKNIFIDIVDDKIAGYGELYQKETWASGYGSFKPNVGFTETAEEFRRKNLGTRRLLMMHAFSMTHFREPLYSADMEDSTSEARAVWEKLVGEGKAKKYNEGVFERYVMIKPKNSR